MNRQLVPVLPRTRASETCTLRSPLTHGLGSRDLPSRVSLTPPIPSSPPRLRVVIGFFLSLHFGPGAGGVCGCVTVCVCVWVWVGGGSGGRACGSPLVPARRQGENSDVLPSGSVAVAVM